MGARPRHPSIRNSASPSPSRPPTKFESRLYDLCSRIPSGRVTTYAAMAKALGSHARAVGQGLRRNPFAPRVPCHRVIASSLELGGFNGSWGVHCLTVKKKQSLLEKEGVAFTSSGKLIKHSAVMDADELRDLMNV